MEKKQNKKYKSKIGIQVYLTYLIFIGIYLIIWLAPPIVFEGVLACKIVSTVATSVFLIFITITFFNTYYVVTDTHVLVVSGLIKKRVFFEQIDEVKIGKSFFNLNSFALSFRKVKLITGKGLLNRIEISPKEEQEFLDELIPLLENSEK